MKQVLFVSYHFPPSVAGGIPRIVDMARLLPVHGWLPTVLTSTPQGRAAIDAQTLQRIPAKVSVVRAYCPFAKLGTRGQTQTSVGARKLTKDSLKWLSALTFVPDRYAWWAANALREAARFKQRGARFDAVLSTLGPASSAVVGHLAAQLFGVPHLVDFRDLWADNPNAAFPTRFHRSLISQIEHKVARSAAHVVTVSDGMSDHLSVRHRIDRSRVSTVTNGIDEDLLPLVSEPRAPSAVLRLFYTGSIYDGYDLNPFLHALRLLKDSGELDSGHFRVHFVGNLSPALVARHGVADLVETEAFLPREDSLRRLNDADALLLVEGGGYWARFGYPAKVFDYFLTGKPILGLVEPGGNTANLLGRLGTHVLARPDSVEEIQSALRQLLAQRGRRATPVDLSQPPLSEFRRSHLIGRLAGVLDTMVADAAS